MFLKLYLTVFSKYATVFLFFVICLSTLGNTSAMAYPIVTIEQPEYHQVLKNQAKKVSFPLTEEDKQLIDFMKTKLHELEGVGLAAPQLNVAKQIVAIYIPENAKLLRDNIETMYPMHILINPSYKASEKAGMEADFEGCYSVTSKAGKVPRFKEIKLSFYDEQGQYHEQIEHGFYARVLQHEIDHLQGILIIDRLTPDCVQGSREEMTALRRAELPEDKKALYDSLMAKKK
jgi:peptide deformylase